MLCRCFSLLVLGSPGICLKIGLGRETFSSENNKSVRLILLGSPVRTLQEDYPETAW